MKLSLKYILKISLVLALAVFIVERLLFGGGFNVQLEVLIKILSIHFLYAISLTTLNIYFFHYLDSKLSWKENSTKRLAIGAVGSVLITMLALVVLRFIVLVVIENEPIESFLNDSNASTYYTFGLIMTLIISLVFHTVFFYKALSEKKVKEQQIVAKTETAKYESLKSQIDPHFLFNSLNVLTSLIGENPNQAEKFTTKLSKVYRYVLEQKNKDLIELDEELQFARTYMELLKMRFEDAVTFEIPEKASNPEYKIIPLSLQLLLENTIKHNVVSEGDPLKVTITEVDGYLKVTNNFNPKNVVEKGTKVGLKNIEERYNLITLKKVFVEKSSSEFTVKLPLLTQKTKNMKTSNNNLESDRYIRAVEQVNEIKEFYSNLISYVVVIPFLIFINYKFTPGFNWFWFPAFGWGIGLVIHGFKAYNYRPFLGRNWEERKIREFMKEDEKQFWE